MVVECMETAWQPIARGVWSDNDFDLAKLHLEVCTELLKCELVSNNVLYIKLTSDGWQVNSLSARKLLVLLMKVSAA